MSQSSNLNNYEHIENDQKANIKETKQAGKDLPSYFRVSAFRSNEHIFNKALELLQNNQNEIAKASKIIQKIKDELVIQNMEDKDEHNQYEDDNHEDEHNQDEDDNHEDEHNQDEDEDDNHEDEHNQDEDEHNQDEDEHNEDEHNEDEHNEDEHNEDERYLCLMINYDQPIKIDNPKSLRLSISYNGHYFKIINNDNQVLNIKDKSAIIVYLEMIGSMFNNVKVMYADINNDLDIKHHTFAYKHLIENSIMLLSSVFGYNF